MTRTSGIPRLACPRRPVRNQLVFQISDHVLQPQLALLQPAQLQLVAARIGDEARNDDIEVAVFDAQFDQLTRDFCQIFHRLANLGAAGTR
jgi:hypothetical protein